jgi:uncharacterized protein
MNRESRTATYIGLAIALLSSPAFIFVYRALTGESHSNLQVIGRELGVFCLVGILLWLIVARERLPLTSIGLQTDKPGKSFLRGLALTVLVLAVTIGLYLALQQFGIRLGSKQSDAFQPSLLVVTLVVLRAGVAEEIFYRGYAIERLRALTHSKWVAALLPLLFFAAAHYRQGLGGVIAAFVLGGIFTLFYLKFRDLLANMVAHFLADFALNVVMPLLTGA